MGKEFYPQVFISSSFIIKSRDEIGLFGINDSGKTTLINILSGLDTISEGDLINNNIKILLLNQVDFFNPNSTVKEILHSSFDYILKAESKLNQLPKKMGKNYSENIFREYSKYSGLFESYGDYDYLHYIESFLSEFNLKPLEKRFFHTLSGGEQHYIKLVYNLFSDADLLLLDEPTFRYSRKNYICYLSVEKRLLLA